MWRGLSILIFLVQLHTITSQITSCDESGLNCWLGCHCDEKNCACKATFPDIQTFPNWDPADSPPLLSLTMSVEVSCFSLADESSKISYINVLGENLLVRPKMGDSEGECCKEGKSETFVDVMSNQPIIFQLDRQDLPRDLEVEIGYEGEGFTCQNKKYYLNARVKMSREFELSESDDSTTRLLLGIVFAIVWTVIMVVPVILWLRRRRAQGPEIAAQNQRLIRQATTRRNAREHGVRTRPRRFKVLKKSDWETEHGDHRRRHGWVMADEAIVREAMEILERDSALMGRHLPNMVVAKMETGWVRVTRARERGESRTIEVNMEAPFSDSESSSPERESAEREQYVLITLPQSVHYSQGVSGQIAIDVHGNIVPWAGTKDTAGFREKVDKLRRGLDRSRRPRFGRDRDELPIAVDRANLWESSYLAVRSLTRAEMNKRFQVAFLGEEGSDFGGVRREWYHLITLEMINPQYGIFEPSAGDPYRYQLATHIDSKAGEAITGAQSIIRGDLEKLVDYLHFAGQVLAKCIVDQQLCSFHFTSAVYKKLLLQPFTVEDLEEVDGELFHSLEWVLEVNADEEDLGMYMCVDTRDTDGNHVTIDLIEGGSEIPVTEANKIEFVHKMINWRLVDRVAVQTDALVAGFQSVLPLELMEPFDAAELELLLCGSDEVDLEDWKVNTLYKSGYTAESEVIKWFWSLAEKMSNEERLKLLQFATGTASIPSRGFANLQGSDGDRRFSIMRVVDTSRLPQAHTCFNELVLPEYPTQEELETKLTQALSHLGDGILLR